MRKPGARKERYLNVGGCRGGGVTTECVKGTWEREGAKGVRERAQSRGGVIGWVPHRVLAVGVTEHVAAAEGAIGPCAYLCGQVRYRTHPSACMTICWPQVKRQLSHQQRLEELAT